MMKVEVPRMKAEVPFFSYVFSFLRMPFVRAPSEGFQRHREDCLAPTQKNIRLRSKFPLSRWELGAIISIFALFSVALLLIYFTMPDLDRDILKIPKNLSDLQVMKEHISVYTKDYTMQVLIGYISTYVFMQTFMIPGTIFFSLLAGALFGVYKGLILVIFSATMGASSCYFLSKLFGAPVALWLWPHQVGFFRAEVAKRKGKLLNYMLFLRVTPTLPNTFINFTSPIVDIPYHIFLCATLFGLIPASILSVRAGLTLGQLESLGDLYDLKTVTLLFIIGVIVILPTALTRPRQRPV